MHHSADLNHGVRGLVDAVAGAASNGRSAASPAGGVMPWPPPKTEVKLVSAAEATTAAAQAALGDMMDDAPLCDTCGHITVRNGSCYKCLNCGNSPGCS